MSRTGVISQTGRTFLENHADCIADIGFFTIPIATFRVLNVFIVLNHDRRQVVHFNVTEHPTARWTAQQLVEAFSFDSAPRYLLRDPNAIYGDKVRRRIKSLGIEEVVTAPRLPWQFLFVNVLSDPYAETVWITSLFSMSKTYAEPFANILAITIPVERIRP